LEWREPGGRTVRQMVSDRDPIKPELSRETDLFCMLRKALGHRVGGTVLGTNKQRKLHWRIHPTAECGEIACMRNFIEDDRFVPSAILTMSSHRTRAAQVGSHVPYWHECDIARSQMDVRFSNRPSGSSAFRLSTTTVSMSLTGSCFSSESAPRPFHHGIRRRGGKIFRSALP